MRIRQAVRSMRSPYMAFAAAVVAALVAASAAPLGASAAAGPNLAYDEITKFVRGDQPTPQPGSFSADMQAVVDAANAAANQSQHHGLFGGIMNAMQNAKTAMAMFTTGMGTRYYYMNGWKRTDDVNLQTAVIIRPDRHQVIHLDFGKKTYWLEDTTAHAVQETPPPYQAPPKPEGPQPSPSPGTGKLDITLSSAALGPKTIESVNTQGFSQDFKMVATESTGSCQDGTFETAVTEYISTYPEPQLQPSMPPKMHVKVPQVPNIGQLMMTGSHPGCQQTVTMHESGTVKAPTGRLAMWMLTTLSGGNGQHGEAGSFSTMVERGNVRTLGSADAALFDVPAGFAQVQQP